MKKQKKQFTKYFLGIIIFCSVFVVATVVKASFQVKVSGWLWGGSDDGNITGQGTISTGAGWISTSSDTTKAVCDTDNNGYLDVLCGGMNNATTPFVTYGVKIPADNTDLSGYAWSSNLGWVSFNRFDMANCPLSSDCGATRGINNSINGWARVVGVVQEGSNAGGLQGWIHLNDTTGNAKYGITINSDTGVLVGNAWSDEFGFVSFSGAAGSGYGGQIPVPPKIIFSADPPSIDIEDPHSDWNTINDNKGTKITLSWSINGVGAENCTKTSTAGNWTNLAPIITNGNDVTDVVYQKDPIVTYTISCHGDGGDTTYPLLVSTSCNHTECGNDTCNQSKIFGLITTSDSIDPNCSKSCSVDDTIACKSKTTGVWKEISP